jgi:hypothetical protein
VASLIKIVGGIRALTRLNSPENKEDEQLQVTQRGDKLVAYALPSLTELVRLGDSWAVFMGSPTVGVTTVPTTTPAAYIWNGEPDNGKSYIIDSVLVQRAIADVTTPELFTVWVQNHRTRVTAPGGIAVNIRSLIGKGPANVAAIAYTGRAVFVQGGAVAGSNLWEPIGSPYPSTALAGSTWQTLDVPLYGRYVVRPGCRFFIQISEAVATAAAFQIVLRWHEVVLDIVS